VQTRQRMPDEWARTFGDEGLVLMLLAERSGNVAQAAIALSQINEAFEALRDGGNARSALYYERELPKARALVTRLRGQ
jgi:hypothetical protein